MQPTSMSTRARRAFTALAAFTAGSTVSVTMALADRAPAKPAAASVPAAPAAQPRTSAPAAPPAPVVQLMPIDLQTVPEACRPLARQAQTLNPTTAMPARISLASCMSERAIAPLELCDCGASIEDINRAAAPAIALVDDVSAKAEPATKLLAEHAKGQLYAGFAVRMRATVPKLGTTTAQSESALRDIRAKTLEAQLTPWHEAAAVAFQRVVEIGKANPQLTSNPAVATALRDSQQRLPTLVAVVTPAETAPATTDPVAPPAEQPTATQPNETATQPTDTNETSDAVYDKR